ASVLKNKDPISENTKQIITNILVHTPGRYSEVQDDTEWRKILTQLERIYKAGKVHAVSFTCPGYSETLVESEGEKIIRLGRSMTDNLSVASRKIINGHVPLLTFMAHQEVDVTWDIAVANYEASLPDWNSELKEAGDDTSKKIEAIRNFSAKIDRSMQLLASQLITKFGESSCIDEVVVNEVIIPSPNNFYDFVGYRITIPKIGNVASINLNIGIIDAIMGENFLKQAEKTSRDISALVQQHPAFRQQIMLGLARRTPFYANLDKVPMDVSDPEKYMQRFINGLGEYSVMTDAILAMDCQTNPIIGLFGDSPTMWTTLHSKLPALFASKTDKGEDYFGAV
ncbi:MAG TPA: hypothetical protein VK338_03620, partial [Candidatus Nitrosocosmicus sp.]|nr:hypothetical protein [Candidatus Nitrosocosmicus sp.]